MKFIKLFLLLEVMILSTLFLYACDNHEHNYELMHDSLEHYDECSCGDRTNNQSHSYIWIIDQEPNRNEDGIKHQECEVCGFKTNTNTIIKPKVINDYVIDPASSMFFSSCNEMNNYIYNTSSIKNGFYYIDIDNIYCEYTNDNSFMLSYDILNEDSVDNLLISIFCSVYDANIGYIKGDKDGDFKDGDLLVSYKMRIVSYPFNYNGDDFSYNMYAFSVKGEIWNNVVYVCYQDEVVCSIYYYTEQKIEIDYFKTLFNERGILINK